MGFIKIMVCRANHNLAKLGVSCVFANSSNGIKDSLKRLPLWSKPEH